MTSPPPPPDPAVYRAITKGTKHMADSPTADPNPELDDPRLAPVVELYAQRAVERAHPRNPERYKAKIARDVLGGDVCQLLDERPSARVGQIVDLLESGQYSTAPAGPAGEDRGQRTLALVPSGSAGEAEPTRRLVARRLDEVQPRQVRWLWRRRIPFGSLSAIVGDPGVGKSTIALDLVARASNGRPMPDEGRGRKPFNCLVLSAEDRAEETIVPRLQLAEADLSRVHVIDYVEVTETEERRWFSLPNDLVALEKKVREEGARLVVVDPFVAYLAQGISANNEQDVRLVLGLFSQMAEWTGAAVLLIRHFNKSAVLPALYRPGGSIGISAAIRSELLVFPDRQDEASHTRVLASSQCNLSAPPSALACRLDGSGSSVRVEWLGVSSATVADLAREPEDEMQRHAQREAEEFLRSELEAEPVKSKEILERATYAGHSLRTLKRAKAALDVTSTRLSDGWEWALPKRDR
jgi:putative DNA primase/helicase